MERRCGQLDRAFTTALKAMGTESNKGEDRGGMKKTGSQDSKCIYVREEEDACWSIIILDHDHKTKPE